MLRRTPALILALVTLLAVLLGAQGCATTASSTSAADRSTSVGQAGGTSDTAPEVDPVSGLDWVHATDLPRQAQDTLRLIEKGGPFPYSKDGSRFGNYEDLLPEHSGSYYREYTVETPGSEDRGARRLIVGDEDETYYTSDHYNSFERVRR